MSDQFQPLEPPESLILRAAEGWLELGNWQEASRELEQIAPARQDHPGVLLVRYGIFSEAKDWDRAAGVASQLIKLCPASALVWIGFAYCTRRKTDGSIAEAKQILLLAEPRFPGEFLFSYNLACYCAQLHEFGEAMQWLEKALAIGGKTVRDLAGKDEDLKPLWERLGGIPWLQR